MDERTSQPSEPQADAPETTPPPAAPESRYLLGQRVWGPILRLTEELAVVALGEDGLDEGTLPLIHLRDEFGNLGVSEGDEVQAFIVELEPQIKLAPSLLPPASEVMRRLQEAQSRGEVVRGRVTDVNRGGLEIDVDGRRAFCPYSQIEIGRCEQPEVYVNHILDFLVTEIDEAKRRVILSRRAILEQEREKTQAQLRAQVQEGSERDGVVTRIQPFGAFVDIGGLEGLVHVSEISHDRLEDPQQVLRSGEKVRVRVMGMTRGKDGRERIRLSIKATLEDPWEKLPTMFHTGDIVTGKVTRVTEFGAFVKLSPGIEGLLHVSQYQPRREEAPRDAAQGAGDAEPAPPASDDAAYTPQAGDEVTVRIARIEAPRRRISLSLRDSERDEKKPEVDVTVGEVLDGVVRAIKPFGIFVDLPSLGQWASGLLPGAETGQPRGSNLKRKYKPGDTVRVEIIDVDERGRIRLSQRTVAEREERSAAGLGDSRGKGGLQTAPPGGFTALAEAFRQAQAREPRARG